MKTPISITIDKKILQSVDDASKKKGDMSRASFIRQAIQEKLGREEAVK